MVLVEEVTGKITVNGTGRQTDRRNTRTTEGRDARKKADKKDDARAELLKFQRQFVGVSVGCLTSQQQDSVSQGRICTGNFTCRYTEIEVADQTFYLIQSQYTHTGQTSTSTDPITPGTWQGIATGVPIIKSLV